MTILLASNKIYKISNKAKSATDAIKPNKNHFKNTKMVSKLSLQFFDVGNHVTIISIYFIFGEK